MNYRREIDGLRGLAVLPVILFHAGFQSFSGGFVGVDVFFVISGYLITSIILTEKREGTFTLVGFYERRVRRILPALFFVMLVCLPFAWLWLLPIYMEDFSQSLIAVSVFASNILFWRQSGYFNDQVQLFPLLHTWSLAVEEQYYLLFPIVLLLTWRLGRRWMVSILAVLAAMSLALAQWATITQPIANFYLLPTRGWELLIGALLAFYLFPKENESSITYKTTELLSLIGLLLIAYGIFAFSESTPYPSLYALVPTIGTGLVILFASPQTIAGRLLSIKPMVGAGLISYSAYLWHQPLLAFVKHRSINRPTTVLLGMLVVGALALAYISWRYVELPFRNRQRTNRKTVFVWAAAMSVTFISLGAYGIYTNGFVDRLSSRQKELNAYIHYAYKGPYKFGACMLGRGQRYSDFSSECKNVNRDLPILLIWGDSHAASLTSGIRIAHPNVAQFTTTSCPPFIDTFISWRPTCEGINAFILGEVERIKPEHIFLHGNWRLYAGEDVVQSLRRTIDGIRGVSPLTKVSVIGILPQWSRALPEIMLLRKMSLDKEQYIQTPMLGELAPWDKKLGLLAESDGVKFLSAISKMCKESACLAASELDGRFQPTAWDTGHLTEAGAVFLARKLLAQANIDSR